MLTQDLLSTCIVAAASGGLISTNVSLWLLNRNQVPWKKGMLLFWIPLILYLLVICIMTGIEIWGGVSKIIPGFFILMFSVFVFRRARVLRRKETIRRDLPTLLDSLVLNVAAGLSLMPAFLTSSKVLSSKSPLREEIDLLKRDTELGTSHSEALARLQERIGLPGSDAALEAIIQALTLGTPVERVLREQSKRMRENLILEGEQFANTLSVKLLAPLFLFILPASFLVILSPVIVALLEYQSW
jgi:tight adherence protein C